MERRRLAPLIALALATVLVACGQSTGATFIPDGGSYSAEDLPRLLANADTSKFADVKTDDAGKVRSKVLATLRGEGDDAAALADTLTGDFPTDVASVPAIVERATYEEAPVWIVIECWGEPGATLAYRRLWVFSYDERAVLAAQSSR